MKKDMAVYLNELTSGDLDMLEQIVSFQYRKFVQFYKLVSQYSYLIDKLKYSFENASTLDVVLTMDSSADMKNIKKELESSIVKSKYEGNIKVSKNKFHISITLQEEK